MLAAACHKDRSVHVTSESFSTIAEKRAALQKYVTLEHPSDTLDFVIDMADPRTAKAGEPPHCDVRLHATIREADAEAWKHGMTRVQDAPDAGWVTAVPHAPPATGFTWYHEASSPERGVLGLSENKTDVLYRLRCYPPTPGS